MNLETDIKECKRCLYKSTHPLGITFSKEGLCSGCRIHEEKDSLDWKYKFNTLKKIVKKYKSKKSYYDVIVPVNGAHDSHFIVHVVKNLLKLNPLLVNYNKYFNTSIGIHNLSNLRIKFNSDILFQNINIKSVKKITKYTLASYGNMYWHCLAGSTVFPVQIAEKYKIPLIIWGAHQGIEQVGMFSYKNNVEMSKRYRLDHDLFGLEAQDLITDFNNINEEDVVQYIYPELKSINSIGIRGLYLNNFIRWDPKAQNEKMIKLYNYKNTNIVRSFDPNEYVDCFNYMNIHDLLKYNKYGYTKVTDQACREIRFGRISKKNAKKLINYYQNISPKYFNLFCEWLAIDINSLKHILNHFKNKNFKAKKNISKKIMINSFKKNIDNKIKEKKYIYFGKGFY